MTASALSMAAMMLPGAVPAVVRRARVGGRALPVPVFATSYFALWALVGLALYALHEPGAVTAGAVTIAAGIYELTPLKRECRLRCQEHVRSGVQFGVYCVGASIGLMAMLAAIGAMSVAWMSIVGAVVLAQKVLPPRAAIDVPMALAIVALGVVVAVAPESVPGVMPAGM
jgi:predicted metal-binding membrane protein